MNIEQARHRFATAEANACDNHGAGFCCRSARDVPDLCDEIDRLREALTHREVSSPSWDTAILCECGERSKNHMDRKRHLESILDAALGENNDE